MIWLITAAVVQPFNSADFTNNVGYVLCLSVQFGWTPGLLVYAWATSPSLKTAGNPIVRSRVALLYERYLGLFGQYFAEKTEFAQLLSVTLQSCTKLPMLGAFINVQYVLWICTSHSANPPVPPVPLLMTHALRTPLA